MEIVTHASKKRRAITPALLFLLLSAAEFLVFYLFILFFSAYSGYYVYFVQRTVLLTLLVAASVTVYKTAKNTGEIILHSALISATRGIFFIPFFYLEFLSNALYDSIDAILLSLLASAVAVVIHAAIVTAVSIIIKSVCTKRGMSENEIARPTDFKSPFAGTVLIISFAIAIINFLIELVTAIIFVAESNGLLFIGEAIYIVISLLFPILMLASIYFISILITMWVSKLLSHKSDRSIEEIENN